MRFTVPLLSVLGTALTAISPLRAAESPVTKPGIRELKLVTDIQAITPGKPFTIALVIDPQAGYHTYWRGPGIVGVATAMKWTLPEGFTAGAIQIASTAKGQYGRNHRLRISGEDTSLDQGHSTERNRG